MTAIHFSVLAMAPILAAGLLASGPSLAADQQRVRLGDMELGYDAGHWRAERTAERVQTMRPVGEASGQRRTVVITQAPGPDVDGCEAVARAQLSPPLYDAPAVHPVDIGGVNAVAVQAPTRCRNAAPAGVAICVPYNGTHYLLTARLSECRSDAGNPFSTIDPLEQIIRRIRFEK